MAIDEAECRKMIMATDDAKVRLMIAYRLHFEEANLKAVELVQSDRLGEPRYFQSSFSMQVKKGDIRVRRETGGGTLYDIGIYCINAARYLFRSEPIEVAAFCASGDDVRFREVDEMTAAILRFPGDRLASFTCSFGAADTAEYLVVGTEASLCLDAAYEHTEAITHYLTRNGKTKQTVFPHRDQFAPELAYFSQCVLEGKRPEPSGAEGLADVRIIEALYRSARDGKAQRLEPVAKRSRPSMKQEIRRRPHAKPRLVHAANPTG
jgi:glucose-fructose oxidoreductase